MEIAKAKEINQACVAFRFAEAVDAIAGLEDLMGVSLKEMIEAKEIILEANKQNPTELPFVCDDRLLAAIYVAIHLPGKFATPNFAHP